MVNTVCQAYNLQVPSIVSAQDNEAIINKLPAMAYNPERMAIDPEDMDYDILWVIQEEMQLHHIEIEMWWVATYQDDRISFNELSFREQLNIWCNGLAKQYLANARTAVVCMHTMAQTLCAERCMLYENNKTIMMNLQDT